MTYKEQVLTIVDAFLSTIHTRKEINKLFGNWNKAESLEQRTKVINEALDKIETLITISATFHDNKINEETYRQVLKDIYG